VTHVGDVHHLSDLEAAVLEVATQQVREDKRAEIADVRRGVHRRPAVVDLDLTRGERGELDLLLLLGVEELERHGALFLPDLAELGESGRGPNTPSAGAAQTRAPAGSVKVCPRSGWDSSPQAALALLSRGLQAVTRLRPPRLEA